MIDLRPCAQRLFCTRRDNYCNSWLTNRGHLSSLSGPRCFIFVKGKFTSRHRFSPAEKRQMETRPRPSVVFLEDSDLVGRNNTYRVSIRFYLDVYRYGLHHLIKSEWLILFLSKDKKRQGSRTQQYYNTTRLTGLEALLYLSIFSTFGVIKGVPLGLAQFSVAQKTPFLSFGGD